MLSPARNFGRIMFFEMLETTQYNALHWLFCIGSMKHKTDQTLPITQRHHLNYFF